MADWKNRSRKEWDKTGLLDDVKEDDIDGLVSKLNEACQFLSENEENVPVFFKHTSVPLIRRIYDELGESFSVYEVLNEYSESQWEARYENLEEDFGISGSPNSSLMAESEVMNEFMRYFLCLETRKEG